jgi:CRISPR system Cascade subunit CasA
MNSFHLASDPWIPCEQMDGSRLELSTLEVLAEAHNLRSIVDSSPLVVGALHRHLLAVLHRVYTGPRVQAEWKDIAGDGRFDVPRTEAYLQSVRDRMDLFHPTHPFAQTRGLVEQFDADPIDTLEVERSSWGTARALFQHRPSRHRPTMSPARAARALLAHHAFATGGLVRKANEPDSATAAPLTKAALVLLRGPTLFRTLISNLLLYDPTLGLPLSGVEGDAPAWEQEPLPTQLHVAKEPKRLPLGWLDLLTWLSRRIELVRDEDGLVTGFVRAVGKGLDERNPRDPMVCYRIDKKAGEVAIGLDPDRAFWRNANALFEASRDGGFIRPKTIDHAANLKRVLGESTVYNVELFGIAAAKSRVDLVRAERIQAVLGLFDDPGARDAVNNMLDLAERAVGALQSALWAYARHALSPGERQPDTKDVSSFVRSLSAEPAAWSELGVVFGDMLRHLADDPDAAVLEFQKRCHAIIEERFKLATASAPASRWLKARAIAERKLRGALSSLTLDPASAAEETQP